MTPIKRVAVAGRGRFGTPIVNELAAAGFETTVLTRSAASMKDVPAHVHLQQVDYDSEESLRAALHNQDALVSAVAMSAIPNQKIMIDAAIAAGVKYIIPAEFTVESRDPIARQLPMLASVIDIQKYLATKEEKVNWCVINCGACIEFAFDVPFIVDFDSHSATLWDGGQGRLSLGNTSIAAKAVVGVLSAPEKVQDHAVHVHGAVVTQAEVYEIAKRLSSDAWASVPGDSHEAINSATERLSQAATEPLSPTDMVKTLVTMMAAMVFGRGGFSGWYPHPDNEWLRISEKLSKSQIEEAIRYRIERGRKGHSQGEDLADVSEGIVDQHNASA